MKLTLNEIKLYLRVEDDEEDSLIESLLRYSVEEIQNSTGATNEKYGELETYKLLQKIIVTDRYENRSSSDVCGANDNIMATLLLKLKLIVESDHNEKLS